MPMYIFLIRSLVVSSCILLAFTSPIPRDLNDSNSQPLENSPELTDKVLKALDPLKPSGANAFQATTGLNPVDPGPHLEGQFLRRDLHESDLSRRAGTGIEPRGKTAHSGGKFPAVRPSGKNPSGALRSNVPKCPPAPERTATQDKTYNNPMKASVDELEDLIRNWLDPKYDNERTCRRMTLGLTYSEAAELAPYRTYIPAEADPTKRHQRLLHLLVAHRAYTKRSIKTEVLRYLQQPGLNAATPNELAAKSPSDAQRSEVPEEPCSINLEKRPPAYKDPINASVKALENLIKWLDKKREAVIVSERVTKREKRRGQDGSREMRKLKDIKPYHTHLPEETDAGKRHDALLSLVITHPAYYNTSIKNIVFQYLDQPKPLNATTLVTKASSQRYPADSSSPHSVDSIQSQPAGLASMSTSGGSLGKESPSLLHSPAHNLATHSPAGVGTVRPLENFGTGTSTLPSAASNLNDHLPHDVFSSMAMNHPIGVRLPQNFHPGTSTLGGSGSPHYDISSSHSLTAAQFQPVGSSSWASLSTEPPSLLHHSAQSIAVHGASIPHYTLGPVAIDHSVGAPISPQNHVTGISGLTHPSTTENPGIYANHATSFNHEVPHAPVHTELGFLPVGVPFPQNFGLGTSTLGASGWLHSNMPSSHPLTAAQSQPVGSLAFSGVLPSTESPSFLHDSALHLDVHGTGVSHVGVPPLENFGTGISGLPLLPTSGIPGISANHAPSFNHEMIPHVPVPHTESGFLPELLHHGPAQLGPGGYDHWNAHVPPHSLNQQIGMGAPVGTDTGGVHHDIISQMAAASPLSDSNLYADGAQASHWHELLHTLDPNSGLIANEHWHSQHPQATNTGSLPSHSTSPYTIDPSHSGWTPNLVPLGPGQHQANKMGDDLSGNTNGVDYADSLGEGHWK